MNEIEKLYENAGIEYGSCQNYSRLEQCCNSPFCDSGMCPDGTSGEKHPFTAEKQLELLKICFDKCGVIGKEKDIDDCMLYIPPEDYEQAIVCTDYIPAGTWKESIAGLVNYIWRDLTSEEKQQIKEILE